MKNIKNFKDFSLNERSEWDYYYGNTRNTQLGRKLQDISNEIRQAARRSDSGERTSPEYELMAKGVSALFNLGSKIADTRLKKDKDPYSPGSSNSDKKAKEMIKREKEWEEFVKSSEKRGVSKFGKDWSLVNPRNEAERKYMESVKKKEKELLDKIK